MQHLFWLIPLVPLIGVAINGLIGPRLPRRVVGLVACATIAVALLLSVASVVELASLPADARHFDAHVATWLPLGAIGPVGPAGESASGLEIGWGFALDPLSAVMILVVTGVGFLIHVYSVGYMAHEEGQARFFTYLNLFMAMMLTLVLGSNLLVMFVGWEGVGLCSYLLIGFFYDRPFDPRTGLSCADAGRKAFLVNRIGDFAFLIGVLFLATTYGTVEFSALTRAIVTGGHAGPTWLLTGVGILLFVGACGKSAQIPLYVWLPDAMAGPTPVSALIHAATMVTAGVYMVCRMSALYAAAPSAMAVVAGVGTATALFAATMGLAATDIKKVLAYSTVSQLGYMFAGAGVGSVVAAMFHLMTHAFFKALLFLGAGSVIHGMSGEQDIRLMGGLRTKMPVTFWTFVVATLSIAGFPLLAGFWSKDEILWASLSSGHGSVTWLLAAGACVTAFYMVRLSWLVFFGEFRGSAEQAHHVHESPKAMTVPLMVLAVLSVLGGGIPFLLPGVRTLERWLEPETLATGAHHAESAHAALPEPALMGIAIALSLSGMLIAWAVYRRPGTAGRIASGFGPLYRAVRNLYWVDELYEAVILKPFYAICRGAQKFDLGVVDGAVEGVRRVTLGLSFLSNVHDTVIVDGLVRSVGATVQAAAGAFRRMQTGMVQNYAAAIVFGMFVLVVWSTWVR